ncbi:hypothetical protein V6N13_018893 [Hibiscus sabdariffa]
MDDKEVIAISPSSSEEDTRLSNITCKQEDEEELKPHICLKKNTDMDMDMEDCFILDSNPFDSVDIAKLSITIDDNDDLSLVAEKGKVFLYSLCWWLVEIIPIQGISVFDFPSIKHHMRNIVSCVTVMFVIQRLHASFGKHIVMLRSMLSTGSLKGIRRYSEFGLEHYEE